MGGFDPHMGLSGSTAIGAVHRLENGWALKSLGGSNPSASAVTVAQLVVRRVVVAVVAGSSPVGHPGRLVLMEAR